MSVRITLARLGSRRGLDDLEPSCGVMDVRMGEKRYRIVVDCGMIPTNGPTLAQRSWNVPDLSCFEDGKPIDAVCITHVHGDHAGFLPALSRFMTPSAKVYMTVPSEAMIRKVLDDAFLKAGEAGTPPFDRQEIADIDRRIRKIWKPGATEILPSLAMFAWPEGHINGACSFTFQVNGKRIHFSGDRCSHEQPGVRGAVLLPEAWRPDVIANSDCTYGADPDADNRSWQEESDKGMSRCAETLRSGAPVVFCSYAVHRGGSISDQLSRWGVPNIAPVYLDGACRYHTDIAQDRTNHWSETTDTLLHLDGIRYIDIEKNRRDQAILDRAYAVVTTPGMGGPGGPIGFWRRQILPNPDALLVFTGYLAPETDGARILAACAERERTGIVPTLPFEGRGRSGPYIENLPLACKVLQIRIGSHDSRGKIIRWFEEYDPEIAVLCHGSSAAMASLEAGLQGGNRRVVRSDLEPTIDIEF